MTETGRILRALGRVAFAAGLLAIGASPARGATFTVTSAADAADIGVGDGLCSAIVGVIPGVPLPQFVFGCTLRAALQEANFAPGEDTVIVPAGSFQVALAVAAVDDAGGDLDVTDDVVITGAGSASTILDASALPAGQRALAITDPAPGDGNPVGLILAGVTIADPPAEGLYAETTTHFELDDVVIRGSGTYGIRKNGVALDQITDSRIAESTSAGLFSGWGDLEIANSVVENNGGGGILNLRGALTVTDSTIQGNTGGDGGIRQQGTSLHVLRTTIHDNHSTTRGGGLRIDGGSPNVIRDTTFSANSTTLDGGAISTYVPLSIANSTLSGNQANGDGGGLFASRSPAIVRIGNCTITGNAADADTSAGGQGGGIAQDYFSEIRVADSVLADNTAAPAAGRDCAGTIDSEGYNVIRIDDCGGFGPVSGDLAGSAGAPLDAQLGPLADNGGPTLTHLPALTSPVVDFGAPAGCPIDDDGLPGTPYVPLLADQRGISRPRDGDGDGFARCDVGAVEVPEPGAGAASVAAWLALGKLTRRIRARRAATRALTRPSTLHPKTTPTVGRAARA